MQQEERNTIFAHTELSSAWLELLGQYANNPTLTLGEVVIPTLESDPWRELLQTKGAEIVDLRKVDLQMSDQDVEQVLQHLQDASTQPPEL